MRQNQHIFALYVHWLTSTLLVTAFCGCSPRSSEQNPVQSISLDGAWEFRSELDSVWNLASVPGNVITDLMSLDRMDSPFHLTNERQSQWVDTTDWVYRIQFTRPAQWTASETAYNILFEGIDTYATVVLNGDTIGKTNNAHRAYRFPADNVTDGLNTLEVWLHSATAQGQIKLDASPWPIPVSNEDQPQGQQTSSVSRKPYYHYGWDWGPRLLSAGLWKSVSLCQEKNSSPQEVRMDLLELDNKQAKYRLHLEHDRLDQSWQLYGPEKTVVAGKFDKISDSLWTLTIDSPQLWWPRGMGDQPLYTLHCSAGGQSVSQRFGIRSIDWVREIDRDGRSFACHINGEKVFARGANIIPADFFPVKARERIEETLQNAIAANMNMLRIWGGAIYGEDMLYDRCDELGLLVWQDFMFACCMVPGDSAFLASVEAEARYNVIRLRNHPSLALWCGNNESKKAWETWGWPKQFGLSIQDSIEIQQAYDALFDTLLPDIVAEESNQFYWASSPMKDPLQADNTGESGDEHAWRVWFDTLDFDYYSSHGGRFASEYGLQSLPNRHTLEEVGVHAFEDESLQFRQRSKMEWLKPGLDGWGMMRIYAKRYAADPAMETKDTDALDRWIYLTQLTQAEGLREALERHRFSRGKTSGSLYWQLNDVWPTVSWSTVDHAGRWKLAHHAVQHANQSKRIIVDRTCNDSLRTAIVNGSNRSIEGSVTLQSIDWSGQVLQAHQVFFNSPPFSENEWNWGSLKSWIPRSRHQVLRWTWKNNAGEVIDTGIQRFAKPSELRLPQAQVTLKRSGNGVILTTDSLAYGVQLTSSIPGRFSSNGMVLIPEESIWVEFFPEAPETTMGQITARHLAQYQPH